MDEIQRQATAEALKDLLSDPGYSKLIRDQLNRRDDEVRGDELRIMGTAGSGEYLKSVKRYLDGYYEERGESRREHTLVDVELKRFEDGEGRAAIHGVSMRNKDVYIYADCFNYGETFHFYDREAVPMTPDDHFMDLLRIISATAGKANRVSVIMPMLYGGRQHKRSMRESLDCAMMLQQLVALGVSNIITFDAHDPRVQNAIPMSGFDDVHPTYQMIKALLYQFPDIEPLHNENLVIVSPDEGGMSRALDYSRDLGLELSTFYKRRDPVTGLVKEHKYLGETDLTGKDVIIVDDMISSGGSMVDTAKQLKEDLHANRVFVFAAFGLFNGRWKGDSFTDSLAEFDRAYDNGWITAVFTTNLIYHAPELKNRWWYREVNMAKYVALLIDTMNRNESLSNLLKPDERIKTFLSSTDENDARQQSVWYFKKEKWQKIAALRERAQKIGLPKKDWDLIEAAYASESIRAADIPEL